MMASPELHTDYRCCSDPRDHDAADVWSRDPGDPGDHGEH